MKRIFPYNDLRSIINIEVLLFILNEIKKDSNAKSKSFPIKLNSIKYFSDPNKTYKRYQISKIPKKTGGFRKIFSPLPTLLDIQKYLNILFSYVYNPRACAYGFVVGRSVVDNANLHIGKKYILNIDISNFFPSISFDMVVDRLMKKPFSLNHIMAKKIAGICCVKIYKKDIKSIFELFYRRNIVYVLPQGAPTSPLLSNAICDDLDDSLTEFANTCGITYSRYADDITFSSDINIFDSDFLNKIKSILGNYGFCLNSKKTRLQSIGNRQIVTGLVISTKVNVNKQYVREIRQLLYIWKMYGYFSALISYNKKKSRLKDKQFSMDLVPFIQGKLNYLKQVKGDLDPVYKKFADEFSYLKRLLEYSSNEVLFISTISLDRFESLFGKLTFNFKDGRYAILHEKVYNHFVRPIFFSISRKINQKNINEISRSYMCVSLCKRKNGHNFFLVHFKNNISNLSNISIEEKQILLPYNNGLCKDIRKEFLKKIK